MIYEKTFEKRPNHVHILFSLKEGMRMEKVLATWKNYTATRINALLGQEGTFWQKDYFDRMVRDCDHFAKVARYIRGNPVKAKLRENEYGLYEDEVVRRVLG
jgi:REP element-mobilizing transposase RayT